MKMNSYNKSISITMHTKKNKTEDKERILQALKNVIDMKYSVENDRIIGKTDSYKDLETIYNIIRDKQIIPVVRRLLRKNAKNNKTRVYINKQAAFVNNIVFCDRADESPLGPIVVTIKTNNVEEFIDWISPRHTR
jgi:predicted RNA binding protein with dsRBD fold (UPF0201 family)